MGKQQSGENDCSQIPEKEKPMSQTDLISISVTGMIGKRNITTNLGDFRAEDLLDDNTSALPLVLVIENLPTALPARRAMTITKIMKASKLRAVMSSVLGELDDMFGTEGARLYGDRLDPFFELLTHLRNGEAILTFTFSTAAALDAFNTVFTPKVSARAAA